MIKTRVAGLVSGAFLVVLAAACSAQPTSGQPTGNALPPAPVTTAQNTVPATTIAPPPLLTLTPTAPVPTAVAPPAATHPPTAVVHTTGTPECTVHTLSLKLGPSDDATGHHFQNLDFTNISKSSCFIVGFPGVSYVDYHGHQVSQPAVRDGNKGPRIVLAPGQIASADVSMTDPGVFDPGTCKAVSVAGLRVYPPDSFLAMFVSKPSTACSGPVEPQLLVQTMVRGPGVV